MKKIKKMKRDFGVNISHELRMVLTSIKGYVETLEGKLDEESQVTMAEGWEVRGFILAAREKRKG